jgi:hypothetical protein
MRRRRGLYLGLAVLSGIATLVLLWPTPEATGLTRASLRRDLSGMTQAEVDGLFGPPTADLSNQSPATPGQGRMLRYDGDGLFVQVEFDSDGRVVRVFPFIFTTSELDRLCLRIGWY